MKRIYTKIENAHTTPNRTILRIYRSIGLVLAPICLLRASLLKVPGIGLQIKCGLLALNLLINRRISLSEALELAFSPFDSVRYFEFDVFWKWLHSCGHGNHYLDVSSPRLFFLLLLSSNPELEAWLVNPDKQDLTATQTRLHAFDLDRRCRTFNCLIAETNLSLESFDIITSISVIEHIPEPDDLIAVKNIWQLLRPGGRLFISVPCAAEAYEEYLNLNEYGILEMGEDGYVYGQRFYDAELLQSRIFRITGQPARTKIYGEVHPGAFIANRAKKNRDVMYPFWRESLTMGQEYRFFEHLHELPGMGVIAMEFVKPQEL